MSLEPHLHGVHPGDRLSAEVADLSARLSRAGLHRIEVNNVGYSELNVEVGHALDVLRVV